MEVLKINSKGPNVELLQSTLKKLGFYNSNLDGIFGNQTQNAVIRFQKEFYLSPDGIVGPDTWDALMPYINGYTKYEIKPGDTLYNLANKYSTTISAILTANPGISANALKIGDVITIPFGSVVPTNISYTYDVLKLNVPALKTIYPFLEIGFIGKSILGNQIPFIKFGKGQKEVLYVASTHSNEWITSSLLMKFIEILSKSYVNKLNIFNYSADFLFNNVSLYVVPMLNPDGVNLVTGLYPMTSTIYKNAEEIATSFPTIPFPNGWKANIKGIDLNLQFPADWKKAKEIKFAQGFNKPAPRDYVGPSPLSEPESIALYNFTLEHNFNLILTYHTQGKVIYWQFQNYTPPISENIANMFASVSGYLPEETPLSSSFAGFKDWFIMDFGRPGFTIEAGFGNNPLPISQFDEIYKDNIGILVLGMLV